MVTDTVGINMSTPRKAIRPGCFNEKNLTSEVYRRIVIMLCEKELTHLLIKKQKQMLRLPAFGWVSVIRITGRGVFI